jgi:hypothetical protein
MTKLMLVSILVASILIPRSALRDVNAQRGLRNVMMRTALFMLAYGLMLRLVYPRMQ